MTLAPAPERPEAALLLRRVALPRVVVALARHARAARAVAVADHDIGGVLIVAMPPAGALALLLRRRVAHGLALGRLLHSGVLRRLFRCSLRVGLLRRLLRRRRFEGQEFHHLG